MLGGSQKLQRASSSDGANTNVAWQAPCSEAVRSSRGQAGLMARGWARRGRAAIGGSPELKKGERADGARMDLAWQAPCSEALRSSRGRAGLMV